MKVFSAPGYLIANARAEVKVVYTGFLAFTAVGLVTMLALQVGRVGFSLEGVATHYRGGDFGEEIRFARTFGELVEVTHFHAFTMGTVYLILAHLFVSTVVPAWLRWGTIVGTLVALLADLGGAWLVRYVSAGFSGLILASWVAEWVGLSLLIGVPLLQMWRPGGAAVDDEDDLPEP